MRHALALIALGAALAFSGGAGSALAAEEPPPPAEPPLWFMGSVNATQFVVWPPSDVIAPAQTTLSIVAPRRMRWPARLVIEGPAGFAVDTSLAEGTWIGEGAVAFAQSATSTIESAAYGKIVVGGSTGSAASARSCAPGQHAAVWLLTLEGLRSRWDEIEVPLFVDRTRSGGWRLQLCIPPSVAKMPGAFLAFSVSLREAVAVPAATGRYAWSAVVTPFGSNRSKPEPDRAYELRSNVLVPHRLTMSGRYDAATGSAELEGRVVGAARGRAGVRVFVGSFDDPEFREFRMLGSTLTDATGTYSFRAPLQKSTTFIAAVDYRLKRCSARANVPAGCLGETTAPPTNAWMTLAPKP